MIPESCVIGKAHVQNIASDLPPYSITNNYRFFYN